MKNLLMRAYELKSYQIAGPAWIDSERYEIAAKIPSAASKQDVPLMLRAMLAERFHLVAHSETRQLSIYELTVARTGPRFHQSAAAEPQAATDDGTIATPKWSKGPDGFPALPEGADVPRSYEVVFGGSDGLMYKLWARRETMQQLADRLSSQLTRPVIEHTGLKEQYDFALAWSIESAGGSVPRTDPPPDEIDVHNTPILSDAGVSIFSALESQLGLKLERKKGPLQMLIVDRIDKVPTAN